MPRWHYHVLLIEALFSDACSARGASCQTLFSVLCFGPYFTAWLQCSELFPWKFEEDQKWKERIYKEIGSVTSYTRNEWPKGVVLSDVLCYDGLMACVDVHGVNIRKKIIKTAAKKCLMGTLSQAQMQKHPSQWQRNLCWWLQPFLKTCKDAAFYGVES